MVWTGLKNDLFNIFSAVIEAKWLQRNSNRQRCRVTVWLSSHDMTNFDDQYQYGVGMHDSFIAKLSHQLVCI